MESFTYSISGKYLKSFAKAYLLIMLITISLRETLLKSNILRKIRNLKYCSFQYTLYDILSKILYLNAYFIYFLSTAGAADLVHSNYEKCPLYKPKGQSQILNMERVR